MKTLTSIILFLFSLQAITMAQSLQRVAPEQVGMDSRKLMYADEAIEEAIANKEIPGAVLAVVRNGKMAYLKAYGNKRIYPNMEPMTANTIFDMASCSKSMSTAICTMILAERGKIRLLDPVSRYIPGFKDWESEDGKDKKVIRITDLLTHKNGQWVNTANSRLSTLDFQLTRVAPTEKQPNGQVLCGQVHDPLARILNGGISGNAGVFSCAEDIAILCAALQNGGEWNGRRILSPQGVKAMRTVPRSTAALGRSLGWDVFTAYASNSGDFFSPNTYGHTGYTGTSIVIDPDNDTSVILLINAVHPEDGHSVVRLRSLVANVVASSLYSSPRIYTDHYYKRFLQFMDEPAIGNKDIVMLGNSLTENGGDWAARLGNKNVRNRGIIGDEVMGVYDRLHQILPGHPAKLFLLIGVNDVSHDLTTDTIVGMIRVTVERIQKESPDTKLYLQSLLPINESFGRYKRLAGKTNMIPEINKQLEELAKEKGLTYINLFPLFTEKGSNVLRAELTTDGLHLKEEGYKIWVKAIRKKI